MEKRLPPIPEATAPVPEPQAVPAPLAEHLPTLLWDVDPDTIDPQAMYRTIIERVIQRGSKEDWAAMLAYYGRDVVQRVVETEPYMSDAAIAAVCQLFNLNKEDLLCYQRKPVDTANLQLLAQLMQEPLLKPFVLVGGTALALQLGHRRSRDIDLFSDGPTPIDGAIKDLLLGKYAMRAEGALPRLRAQEPDWDKAAIQGIIGQVKTDVVNYGYPLVRPAELYPGTPIRMASAEDISAMKLAAIGSSGKRLRDFVDVAALSEKLSLEDMLRAYQGRYRVNSSHAERALHDYSLIDHSMKPEMKGYAWGAVEKRLAAMRRSPNKLFPPLLSERLLMPTMESIIGKQSDQLAQLTQQNAAATGRRGPKF